MYIPNIILNFSIRGNIYIIAMHNMYRHDIQDKVKSDKCLHTVRDKVKASEEGAET